MFQQPHPLDASCYEVRALTYDNLTLKVYGDDQLIDTIAVDGRDPGWLVEHDAVEDYEIEVEGTDELQWVTIADDMTELGSGG